MDSSHTPCYTVAPKGGEWAMLRGVLRNPATRACSQFLPPSLSLDDLLSKSLSDQLTVGRQDGETSRRAGRSDEPRRWRFDRDFGGSSGLNRSPLILMRRGNKDEVLSQANLSDLALVAAGARRRPDLRGPLAVGWHPCRWRWPAERPSDSSFCPRRSGLYKPRRQRHRTSCGRPAT